MNDCCAPMVESGSGLPALTQRIELTLAQHRRDVERLEKVQALLREQPKLQELLDTLSQLGVMRY